MKKPPLFEISVTSVEHGEWQGTVTFPASGEQLPFGSLLELKLADLENELREDISLESFLSGFKLALGIAAELAPSYSFDDDEEERACEALRQRRGE